MDVRLERPGDHAAIRALHVASFPTPDEAHLVDALRDAGRLSISFVAVEGDDVVAHVAFSPVTVLDAADDAARGVGLAPVATLPDFRRRGIADRLIREGLALCKQRGYGFVVVLGSPAHYGRFGFTAASGWGLIDEYGGGEAFQAQELLPAAIPAGGGRVQYAPEFAAFE